MYALLLGSGVSRSAGIPTGWDVVKDLIGKLAATTGEVSIADPEQWYVEKYQESPDYSKLLGHLARTQTERQQLLRPYFEPNAQEQEEGLKQPTAAHKAIAWMVARGFIKVIVTTNFDRLIEKALEDEGITPNVLSTSEQVNGSLPLDHIDCCVLKVHGDYMDPMIRNTQSELDEYPPEIDQLLDRVFDEYGLIVCGWSAEWDQALCNALSRASSRRFSTYWATYGDLSDSARRLADHRGAQVIPDQDADGFFGSIQENVESIEEYSKPHPLSTEAAVASLKRYLAGQEYRIQLSDHIDAAVEQVIQATTGEGFEMGYPIPDAETRDTRQRHYESASETLLHMAAVGGYWADEENSAPWERAVERLSATSQVFGMNYPEWIGMRMYPATLLVYALGIGALDAGNLHLINRIFNRTVMANDPGGTQGPVPALVKLTHAYVDNWQVEHILLGGGLHKVLRQPLKALIPEDDKYSYVFDKFELIAALGFANMRSQDFDWFRGGISHIRRPSNWARALDEIKKSVESSKVSEFVQSGIMGDSPESCMQLIKRFEDKVPQFAR